MSNVCLSVEGASCLLVFQEPPPPKKKQKTTDSAHKKDEACLELAESDVHGQADFLSLSLNASHSTGLRVDARGTGGGSAWGVCGLLRCGSVSGP